jgi:hypothetical protein
MPDAAFDAGGEQLQRAGAELMQVANRQAGMELNDARQQQAEQRQAERQAEAEARAEQRQREAEARRAAEQVEHNLAAVALANYEADIGEAEREIGGLVQRGELTPSDALSRLGERESAARATRFPADMNPLIVGAFEDNLVRVGTSARDGVLKAGEARVHSERQATFGTLVESLQRLALTNPDGAVERARSAFGTEGTQIFGPEGARQRLQGFEEGVARQRATALVTGDPRAAVRQLRDVTFLPALDPQQRTTMLATAEQRVAIAEQRAAAAADRVARENQQEFAGAVALVQSGKVLRPAYVDRLNARFRGGPFAAAFSELVQQAPAAQAFAAQPLASQERALFELQRQGNTPGAGWAPADREQYTKLSQSLEATRKAVREDPWQAALERGVIQEIPTLSLNLSTLPSQLASLQQGRAAIERWTGQPQPLLRPSQIRWLADNLKSLQPREQVDAIRTLTAGDSPGQVRALSEAMGRQGLPALASIALHSRTETQSMLGRPVAELIARGQNLIDTKSVKINDERERGLRSSIRNAVRGAFATMDAENMAVEDAYRIAAALHSEGRSSESSLTIRDAVALATGGIWEHNGVRTTVRYGATEVDMRRMVEAQTTQVIAQRAGGPLSFGDRTITPEELYRMRRTMQFTATGNRNAPGERAVSIGGRPVMRADGAQLTLELWKD